MKDWSTLKKLIKNQNPVEVWLKGVKHFDAQNPVIGPLIMEVDIAKKKKKKGLSKFLDKAPGIRDLEIRERLNKLCEKEYFF